MIRPSMNMFSRFIRITKVESCVYLKLRIYIIKGFISLLQSHLNHFLWRLEDPEKVMNQAVIDLNNDLAKIRYSYAEVLATQKRMEKDRMQTEEAAVEVPSI